ncbi:MAG: ECF transporter S component [Peptoniphilus sp.]|uniref:ECF transporter S component n=1 Tax=Peptoniphilus sp. TaxID=1971214 RepID=UPI002A74A523|nr:ECF transporter S component [Peptoniphilus sp.]MDY2986916.1 ECF transporter S component [Peptoniphilus sp.]
MNKVNSKSNVKVMSRIGMLSAVAFLLMFFEFPLTFIAPSFIKLDISDLPAMVGAFTMGPVAGVIISAVKNVLHIALKGTSTGGVGELSNFIIASVLTGTAGIIYKRDNTFKGAIVGMLFGTVLMTIAAIISNYFVIFPLYANFMPMEAIINAGKAVNANISSLWDMMIYSLVPFNLIKGFLVSIVTMLIYKKISHLFRV